MKMKKIRTFDYLFKKAPEFGKIKRAAAEGEVLEKFHEIFKGYETIAVPRKIVKGILYIEVENAAWRNELKFRDEEIAARINEFFGGPRVKKVIVTN
jgi:hypothetical protein